MVRKGQARPQYQFSPCAASRRSTRVDAASGQNCFTASTSSLVAGFSLPQPRGLASAAQLDGLGRLAPSRPGARGGGVFEGATLFGFTSVLPTKVTPSSMTSLEARMSPKTSALDLIS